MGIQGANMDKKIIIRWLAWLFIWVSIVLAGRLYVEHKEKQAAEQAKQDMIQLDEDIKKVMRYY